MGQTNDPSSRLSRHKSKTNRSRVTDWIEEMDARGSPVCMWIIDAVHVDHVDDHETYWINVLQPNLNVAGFVKGGVSEELTRKMQHVSTVLEAVRGATLVHAKPTDTYQFAPWQRVCLWRHAMTRVSLRS